MPGRRMPMSASDVIKAIYHGFPHTHIGVNLRTPGCHSREGGNPGRNNGTVTKCVH